MDTKDKILLRKALSLHNGYIEKYGFPTLDGFLRGEYLVPREHEVWSELIQCATGIVGCLQLDTNDLCDKDLTPPPAGLYLRIA